MDVVLGLLGVAAWIAVTIALAAVVTWLTVKVFPAEKRQRPAEETDATA